LAQLEDRVKTVVSLEDNENYIVGTGFELFQNYPNPFNPSTTIRYTIPSAGEVKIFIYNIIGKRVKTLFEGYQNSGTNSVNWNGRNDFNAAVGAGIYFYTVKTSTGSLTGKMILMK
jgi:hypothetical protein